MKTVVADIPVKWLIKSYQQKIGMDISKYFPPQIELIQLVHNDQTLVSHFEPTILGDDIFYQALASHDWYYQETKAEFFTARRVTKGKSVCEVGCGFGAFQEISLAKEYVGLELNSRAVSVAKSRGRHVVGQTVERHLEEGYAEFYDVLCAFQVLEHVVEPDELVSSMCRLLRPGGKLILSVPTDESFMGFCPNNLLNFPPHHQTRWTSEALAKLEERHEVNTVAIISEKLDAIHFGMAKLVLFGNCIGSEKGLARKLIFAESHEAFFYRVRRQLSRLALGGRFEEFLKASLRGHSITGIFEKRK